MASDIEVVIILKDFAVDIKFDQDVEALLTIISNERFVYSKKEQNKEIEFHFVANTGYLNNKLIPKFDELIAAKDKETQLYLSRQKNILLRYKLYSSATDPKETSFEDFKGYLRSL